MRRKIKGTSLILVGGDQLYTTEDGRYQVAYDDGYYTDCDGPHAIRWPRSEWKMGYDRNDKWRLLKGEYCEGGAEHTYGRWHIWDNQSGVHPDGTHWGDYAFDTGPGAFGTFADAAFQLAVGLGKVVPHNG